MSDQYERDDVQSCCERWRRQYYAVLNLRAAAERRATVLEEALRHVADECGVCGRIGFGEDAIRIARGEDEAVRPCPECAIAVRALASGSASGAQS